MLNYLEEKAAYESLATTPEAKQVLGWQPLPVPPVAPSFPVEALPLPLADMARAVAENCSVPVDLPAVTGLAVLAACACGRVSVHIRKGWDEPCNLYLMPVIDSGGGKTPTFRAMGQFLFDWQNDKNRALAAAIAADAAELEVLQASRALAVKKRDIAAAREAGEAIANFSPTRPIKRFISGNTTPEQLISLLDDSGAVSILDDDGGQLLDMLAGQYTSRPNIEPYLKGFDGGTIISERRSGSMSVPHAYLTALVMLQPSAFQDMLSDPRTVGRGFLARFLFCMPEPSFEIGAEDDIPDSVIKAYKSATQGLLDMPNVQYILSEEARRCFLEWRGEATRRCATDWTDLHAYAIPKKLISNVARIAGLLKLLDSKEEAVTAAMMRDAIAIVEYFAMHMLRTFKTVAPVSLPAKSILSMLAKNGQAIQREREIKRALADRKMFKQDGVMEAALVELEKAKLIRRTRDTTGDGRPISLIELHPDLLPKVEVEEI